MLLGFPRIRSIFTIIACRPFPRQINLKPLPECFRRFVQGRERGVQHLARFQSRKSRRVAADALGDLRQRQSLAFSDGDLLGAYRFLARADINWVGECQAGSRSDGEEGQAKEDGP